MAAFIKLEEKESVSQKIRDEITESINNYIEAHKINKITKNLYFTDKHISPSIMKTIINTVKGIDGFKKVFNTIYYTNNLSKI